MTPPVLITPKTTPIEAYQFTGGVRNAGAIDTWLDKNLAGISRRGAIAVQLVPAVEDVYEDDMLVQVADPEHLAIFTIGGRHRVEVGGWIILDPVTIFKVVAPGDFDSNYSIEETA